jgi:hypothetical protein
VNVCRYITGIENLYTFQPMMWGNIGVFGPSFGHIFSVKAAGNGIELNYPGDRRRTRSHEIYVTSHPAAEMNYTRVWFYYIARPNIWILEVMFR